jgi:FKBP-type peptidyl-prolyl cis-trans isomerase FklB
MKKQIFTIIAFVIPLVSYCQIKNPKLKNLTDSASYALGFSVSSNLAQNNLDSLNLDAFIIGYKEAQNSDLHKISESELDNIIKNYAEVKLKEKFASNIIKGDNFLAENKKKKGVITTPSGLQYEIITVGKGKKVELNDSITVHYNGTKLDGTIFDSSLGTDPTTFQLVEGGLIEGWIEALQLMNEGSKYKFYIPQNLGYGMSGNQTIEPFETIIFEIDLIKVVKQSEFKYSIDEIPMDENNVDGE